jgi:fatty acid desaturase
MAGFIRGAVPQRLGYGSKMSRPSATVALAAVTLAAAICFLIAAIAMAFDAKWVLAVVFAFLALGVWSARRLVLKAP